MIPCGLNDLLWTITESGIHMSSISSTKFNYVMIRHASVKWRLWSYWGFFKDFEHTCYSGANASFKIHVLNQEDVM